MCVYVCNTHMHTYAIYAYTHAHEHPGFQPLMKSQKICKLGCIFTHGSLQRLNSCCLYTRGLCAMLRHNPTPPVPHSFTLPAWSWEACEFATSGRYHEYYLKPQ